MKYFRIHGEDAMIQYFSISGCRIDDRFTFLAVSTTPWQGYYCNLFLGGCWNDQLTLN